jgi:hypothetical protein
VRCPEPAPPKKPLTLSLSISSLARREEIVKETVAAEIRVAAKLAEAEYANEQEQATPSQITMLSEKKNQPPFPNLIHKHEQQAEADEEAGRSESQKSEHLKSASYLVSAVKARVKAGRTMMEMVYEFATSVELENNDEDKYRTEIGSLRGKVAVAEESAAEAPALRAQATSLRTQAGALKAKADALEAQADKTLGEGREGMMQKARDARQESNKARVRADTAKERAAEADALVKKAKELRKALDTFRDEAAAARKAWAEKAGEGRADWNFRKDLVDVDSLGLKSREALQRVAVDWGCAAAGDSIAKTELLEMLREVARLTIVTRPKLNTDKNNKSKQGYLLIDVLCHQIMKQIQTSKLGVQLKSFAGWECAAREMGLLALAHADAIDPRSHNERTRASV